jgi:type 1 glutamine amidotransferase
MRMNGFARLLMAALALMMAPASAWAQGQFKLLVLAIPNKYHYEYIPVARESLERLAKLHSFEFTWTNKPEAFESDLSQYAAVMFLNTPGEELNPAQRKKFEDYMRAGGNAIVVHRAAIAKPNDWVWYEKMVGRTFVIHPMLQTGVVTIADKGFPATYGLPDRWIWSDEYYVTRNPYNVVIHPVLNVDETSYDPTKIWPGQVAKPMGKDHPVAWYHQYEKGRVFVTLLGHNVEMYRDQHYLDHLMGGIYWAATGLGQQH